MRKVIKYIAIVLFLVGILFIVIGFVPFTNQNFKFNIIFNKIHITDYLGKEKNLVIPSKIYGLNVVSIDGLNLSPNTERVEISEGVISINNSFSNCCSFVNSGNHSDYDYYGLKYIKLPESLKEIKGESFFGNKALKTIYIPKNVEVIDVSNPEKPNGDDIPKIYIFDGCINLQTIDVDSKNVFLKSYDGVLYDYKNKSLLKCPEGKTGNVVIPDWAKRISYFDRYDGYSPFANCNKITNVSIPMGFDITKEELKDLFFLCKKINPNKIEFKVNS